MPGFASAQSILEGLGKHKVAKSCLYIKGLSDVRLDVLENLIDYSVRFMEEKYGIDKLN